MMHTPAFGAVREHDILGESQQFLTSEDMTRIYLIFNFVEMRSA